MNLEYFKFCFEATDNMNKNRYKIENSRMSINYCWECFNCL